MISKFKESSVVWIILFIFLGLLWAPLGQVAFLVENWMKVSTYSVPLYLIVALSITNVKGAERLKDIKLLCVFMLAAYMIHQYEEHWVDFFGRNYAFYESINKILGLVPHIRSTMPLTPEAIFVINTSLVWLVGLIAIIKSPKHIFPALAIAAIILINAIGHIMGAILKLEYNPGLVTSLFLFLPLSGYFFRRIHFQYPRYRNQIKFSLAWAGFGHLIMFGGVLLSTGFEVIPVSMYYLAMIAWSFVPAMIFLPKTEAFE